MRIKSKHLLYLLPAVLLVASCTKDFLNINTDPNNPGSVAVSTLLPNAQRNLGDALSIGGSMTRNPLNTDVQGLSQILAVYTHQMSTREEPDQYGARGSHFAIGDAWPLMYEEVIAPLDDIIDQSGPLNNYKYIGIAKIMKAYAYSVLVDVFGDVPFSEANKLDEGIRYPKFDEGSTIYPQLITMLDEGIADLKNTAKNTNTPGSDDAIYNGNVTRWEKAANTIKLKLYTQVRKKQNVTAQVTALLADPTKLINATNEMFVIPYGAAGATEDRNPGFSDYIASQRSNHVSPWFYEILKGYNQRIFAANPDPRIPYYFFNQLTKTQTPNGQTEYRDSAFVSIYFGSGGPDRDRGQQTSITLWGIYPVGGRYDDGAGGVGSASSGTGAAPYRMITFADRLYMEAELIKEGVVAGDARAKLKSAIEESFKQVDYVVTNYVKPTQTVPPVYNTALTSPMNVYINKVLAEYDNKPAQQLEIIMTQKWISNFGNAVDQYNDYRRTGYPVLFNPNDPAVAPNGMVQPPLNGDPVGFPGAQRPVPVSLSRPYPLTLPWFQDELEQNANAPEQKNPSTFKVFWMP
jgi:hypothetical protein